MTQKSPVYSYVKSIAPFQKLSALSPLWIHDITQSMSRVKESDVTHRQDLMMVCKFYTAHIEPQPAHARMSNLFSK